MKFKITMKDPDGVYECVQEAAKASVAAIEGLGEGEREMLLDGRVDDLNNAIRRWFEFGEYITVEVDTVAATIRVCEKD